jgi:site-specific recombinase XerD
MQNTRSTFGLLFYLNTSKVKKSGKCPILGRISIDGKNTAFSTGLDILPSEWDTDTGMAMGKNKENIVINKQIDSYKFDLEKHYRSMVENKGFVTAETLKNALRGIGINQSTVMQEFHIFLEEKRKSVGIRITNKTLRFYEDAYKHFKRFLMYKYGVEDITFGKVDIALVESYSYYLKIDLKMQTRTLMGYMMPFRSIIRRAYNKGLLRQNPLFEYTYEKVISKRRWLSNEEIERLMKVELKHRPKWIFTRDMFIFSTFTGISLVDLKNLQHSNIQQQTDGSRWIVLDRQKTGTTSYIPLLDIPAQILDKYKNTRFSGSEGKVFKLPTQAAINLQLKQLAKVAEIDKTISYHVARHSFATSVCLTNGVPIETLSQMMGHLSIKTTQIYAKVTRTKLNEDMTKLEKRIEGKYQLPDTKIIKHSNN